MSGKLTLITPPDFFENGNRSILFVHLSDEDQDAVSRWLADAKLEEDVNLYVYMGEPTLPWFFYAMARCEYKYIDLNGKSSVTDALGGYILGKSDVFYKTDDANLAAIYSHINSNRIDRIETFMESIFGGQTT
jgi:hypothetical protein